MESDSKNNEQLLNNEEGEKVELEKKEENENNSQKENDVIDFENNEQLNEKSDKENENENQKEKEKENDNLENENVDKNDNLDVEIFESKSKIVNNEEDIKDNIKGKYDDLSLEEIIEEVKKKNTNLIELNEEKEQNKIKLNSIVKELNELISDNQDYLYIALNLS